MESNETKTFAGNVDEVKGIFEATLSAVNGDGDKLPELAKDMSASVNKMQENHADAIAAKDEELGKVNAELKALRDESAEVVDTVAARDEEITSLKAELATANEALEAKSVEVVAANETIEAKMAEIADLKAKNEELAAKTDIKPSHVAKGGDESIDDAPKTPLQRWQARRDAHAKVNNN